MTTKTIFRPNSNLVWAAIAIILDSLYLIQSIFYNRGASNVVIDIVVAIFIGVVAYLFWIRPKITLTDSEVVVVNPLRTKTISYKNITELSTKWSLLIHHDGISTRVWVAPANGKRGWISSKKGQWRSNSIRGSQIADGKHEVSSRSELSDSGIVANLIEKKISRH